MSARLFFNKFEKMPDRVRVNIIIFKKLLDLGCKNRDFRYYKRSAKLEWPLIRVIMITIIIIIIIIIIINKWKVKIHVA